MAHVKPNDFCICGVRFENCIGHRGNIGREYAWQWVSDDQLRAECERRFPSGFGVVHEVTLRERDEYKAAADRLVKERNELQRQYECCHEFGLKLLGIMDRNGMPAGVDTLLWLESRLGKAKGWDAQTDAQMTRDRDEWRRRAEAAETELAKWQNPKLERIAHRVRESGPGIAAQRPDHSVAWLDEELLCADE